MEEKQIIGESDTRDKTLEGTKRLKKSQPQNSTLGGGHTKLPLK